MRKRTTTPTPVPQPAPSPTVEETSAKLNEELKRNSPSHIEFEAARGSPKPKPANLSPDFERITETVFVDNALDVYKKLEADLRVGEKRTDHGSVNAALDNAETNARMAHKLWMTAKIERAKWEIENAQIFAGMRTQATRVLQAEKDDGKRTKQITDADVESTMALLYGDEWQHHEMRRKKVKAMEDSMENLNELWSSRCRSLQAMLAKQR